jgi:hypothetical protein
MPIQSLKLIDWLIDLCSIASFNHSKDLVPIFLWEEESASLRKSIHHASANKYDLSSSIEFLTRNLFTL